jgi:hypothetical protein
MARRLRSITVIVGILATGCQKSPTAPSNQAAVGDGRTYYVAANQLGADNGRCDGSAPTDQGNGRCPFRDFRSPRTAALLAGGALVRVEVRAGTYTFVGEGLTVNGAGTTPDQGTVLTSFDGETVIFDGEEAFNGTVRVSGRFVTISGITFIRGGGANLEVRGGQQVRVLGNRFLSNRSSDSLKGSAGAADVEIRDNEFSNWDSQAIDITSGTRWTIVGNHFHDALQPRAKAIGAKLGARDIRISGNRFRRSGGIALGGTASAHPDTHEGFGIIVEDNRFEDIGGHVATFYSCLGCGFSDNVIDGAERGVRLGGLVIEGSSGCPGGCQPTRDATVTRNRLRALTGDAEAPAGLFWLAEGSERQGLTAAENLYCIDTGQQARFAYAGSVLGFAEWVRSVASDTTSVVAPAQDQRCQGW